MKKISLYIMVSTLAILFNTIQAQSVTQTEFIPYTEYDGLIVLKIIVNGVEDQFLLDIAGKTTILPEFAKEVGFADKEIDSGRVRLTVVAMGDNAYQTGVIAYVANGEEAEYLRKAGLAGTINNSIFMNSVLTIDKRGNRVFVSQPQKPEFIKLVERTDYLVKSGSKLPEFVLNINAKPINVIFDTRETSILKMKGSKPVSKANISLINVHIKNAAIKQEPTITTPIVGLGLLDHGLLSIDFQRGKIYFQSYDVTQIVEEKKAEPKELIPGKLNEISKIEFLAYIHDYKTSKEFILKSDKPVVVDFWANWCGPCKKMMPYMEQLAEKYKDQIIFCKVNTDVEKELASVFNVNALPTLFFIPVGGKPIVDVGAQPEKYLQIIEENLLMNKD